MDIRIEFYWCGYKHYANVTVHNMSDDDQEWYFDKLEYCLPHGKSYLHLDVTYLLDTDAQDSIYKAAVGAVMEAYDYECRENFVEPDYADYH